MSEQLRERGAPREAPRHEPHESGWEAWEQIPQDYPAVFVLDTDLFDDHGLVHGAWLAVDQPFFASQLESLLGRPPSGWAIVDQVGLGERMLPETFEPDELPEILRALRSEPA